MRPVVAIHGVQSERDAAGFSAPLKAGVESLCDDLDTFPPAWSEVVWSDLMDIPDGGLRDIAELARDVFLYETSPIVHSEAQARVRQVLDVQPVPPVVVAHSLGSVVAIDLLIKSLHRSKPLPFPGLLTLGSPLGVDVPLLWENAFRDRAQRLSFASGPRPLWIDAWATHDSIHTGFAFGLTIAKGAKGLKEAGYPCLVSHAMDLGTDPLKAHTGYWASPLVARWVADLCSRDLP